MSPFEKWICGFFKIGGSKGRVRRSRAASRLCLGRGWQGLGARRLRLEPLEERTLLTVFMVDDDFNAAAPGWQVTAFDKIQDAMDAAALIDPTTDGDPDHFHTINVAGGTYDEHVRILNNPNLVGLQLVGTPDGDRATDPLAIIAPTSAGITLDIQIPGTQYSFPWSAQLWRPAGFLWP